MRGNACPCGGGVDMRRGLVQYTAGGYNTVVQPPRGRIITNTHLNCWPRHIGVRSRKPPLAPTCISFTPLTRDLQVRRHPACQGLTLSWMIWYTCDYPTITGQCLSNYVAGDYCSSQSKNLPSSLPAAPRPVVLYGRHECSMGGLRHVYEKY